MEQKHKFSWFLGKGIFFFLHMQIFEQKSCKKYDFYMLLNSFYEQRNIKWAFILLFIVRYNIANKSL